MPRPIDSAQRIAPLICPAIQAAIMTLAARIRINCKELRAYSREHQMYWMKRKCIRDMADALRELRWATR